MSGVKLVLVATFAIQCLTFARPAGADVPATLSTTIVASHAVQEPAKAGRAIEVAASPKKEPGSTAELTFPLQSLPRDAKLKVCALRLVMADPIEEGDDNGVHLILLEVPVLSQPETARTVAGILVPSGTPKGTSIILRSRALCEQLQDRISKNATEVHFRLKTNIRNGAVSIVSKPESPFGNPSVVPRLLLTYDLPNGLPGAVDWSQFRQDAQRSGRSPWKLYDPGGTYAPTEFAAIPLRDASGSLKVRNDLRQSPLLFDRRIYAVLPSGADGLHPLVATDRSGKVLDRTMLKDKPTYLAAGGSGRLVALAENSISDLDVTSLGTVLRETPIEGETLDVPPTVGADGALYIVAGNHVRAYSPTGTELWWYGTEQDNLMSTVTLSQDMKTAYVLFAGTDNPRLLALDSATGECRLVQKLPGINRGSDDPMPIPVAAGNDVLFTLSFPTKDRPRAFPLYVIHDNRPAVASDQGELVSPQAPDSCRTVLAQDKLTTRESDGDRIATAVAGVSDDAFYVRSGQLCWSRTEGGSPKELCIGLDGCDMQDTKAITHLIGDSNGINTHLYGLAAELHKLLFISAQWKGEDVLAATCMMQEFPGLGPNLILGPDATLYNINESSILTAIVPKAFAASALNLTLSKDILKDNNDTAFRVPGTISTADGLSLEPDTNIILVAGQKISFALGLRVAVGARLHARVGF